VYTVSLYMKGRRKGGNADRVGEGKKKDVFARSLSAKRRKKRKGEGLKKEGKSPGRIPICFRSTPLPIEKGGGKGKKGRPFVLLGERKGRRPCPICGRIFPIIVPSEREGRGKRGRVIAPSGIVQGLGWKKKKKKKGKGLARCVHHHPLAGREKRGKGGGKLDRPLDYERKKGRECFSCRRPEFLLPPPFARRRKRRGKRGGKGGRAVPLIPPKL